MAGQTGIRFTLTSLLACVAALCMGVTFFAARENSPEAVPAETEAPFEFPTKLRIATYNLQNFYESKRRSSKGKFHYRHPKPEVDKQALYQTILEVRPDVLAVQEIGGEMWLDEFAESLAQRGLAFPYRVCLHGHDAYNRLAILSRVPFSKTVEIVASKKLARGLLGVVIPVAGGGMLRVYNVHLKSKISHNPDDPECNAQRLSEARYVRRLIDFCADDEKTAEKIPASARFPEDLREKLTKNPSELFALLGDFNDVPASKSLAPFEVEAFAHALPAKNENGGVFTYFNPNRGYFHTFDRIFVSPDLFKKFYVPASAKIAEFPYSQKASDHRLVYADFDFSPKTKPNG